MAFRRFAQDALIRFDMAFLAAALQGFRVRFFCVAAGLEEAPGAGARAFFRFAQNAFIRLLTAAFCAAVIARRFGVG